MGFFGSKRCHFWTIQYKILIFVLIELFFGMGLQNGLFSLKNVIEIILRRFWTKKEEKKIQKKFQKFFFKNFPKFLLLNPNSKQPNNMKNARARSGITTGGCIWTMSIRNCRKKLLIGTVLHSSPSSIRAIRVFYY